MKKLLITGFEPFGGEVQNPSWDAVALLPDQIAEYALCKLRLPVVFGEAPRRAIFAAEKEKPDAILCVGQAGGKNAVTPELVGINLMHAAIPDNGGNQPLDEPILPGGSAAYFPRFPFGAWPRQLWRQASPQSCRIVRARMSATMCRILCLPITAAATRASASSMSRLYRNRQKWGAVTSAGRYGNGVDGRYPGDRNGDVRFPNPSGRKLR